MTNERSATTATSLRGWALLTAALYIVTLVVLTAPLLIIALLSSQGELPRAQLTNVADGLSEMYRSWEYWLTIGVLGLLEAALLFVPLRQAQGRPVGRVSWFALAAAAGAMMGLLMAAFTFAIVEVSIGKDYAENLPFVLGVGLGGWLLWAAIFFVYARAPEAGLARILDTVMTGSVLELLIAVPAHVYARNQTYCCAGFGTFMGLATGLTVLLFAFGPGVLFLFARRVKRLRGSNTNVASSRRLPDRHLRDAFVWSAFGLACLLLPSLLSVIQNERLVEISGLGRIAFSVMIATAAYHALRSATIQPRHSLWVLAFAALLIEGFIITLVRGF